MTREEILAMSAEQVEARANELAVEVRTATTERLTEIDEELTAIEERRAQLKKANEIRQKAMNAVANGAGSVVANMPTGATRTVEEVRSSSAYTKAFAKYIKTGKDIECRALLTENVAEPPEDSSGPVPVPTFIEQRIRTAWERDEIWRRISKTFARGNLKVGFEISATGAVVHTEGSEAPAEEVLTMGIVTMVPEYIKKWIKVSDNVLSLAAESFLMFVYDELTYKIIQKAGALALDVIAAAPTTSTDSAVGIPVVDITTYTDIISQIIMAKALLGPEARDVVVITSAETAAQAKLLALNGNYMFDPFDGSEVITTTMPDDVSIIVGDLAGVQANLPNGDAVQFILDEYSLAEDDMVKIVGKMLASIEVVGPGMFAVVPEGN